MFFLRRPVVRDNPRRHAHRRHPRGQVPDYHSSGPDNCPVPDGYAVDDRRARANETAVADAYVATNRGGWIDVGKIAHHAVVRYGCLDVKDAMPADVYPRRHHAT